MAISFTFNPFTGNFDAIDTVTLAPVGSSPNANAGTISGDNTLTLEPANTSFPGVLLAADWNTFNNAATLVTTPRNPNLVFAGPASGSAASPTFRTLVSADIPDLSALYVTQSEVGQPNGVASLDGSGKVPSSELPSTLLEYQGLWNPATNTPILQDSTGINAYVYQVSMAFPGPIIGLNSPTMVNFQVGNLVIYSSAAGEWQQADSLTGVTSVNGSVGAVTVNAINQLTGDGTAGPASGSQSQALTLTTVNSNVGTFGTASAVGTFTVNAKGLITAASSTTISLPTTQLTGTLQAAQFPALTGDVTTTAGSLATSLVATSNATLTTLSALTTASSLASVGTITTGTWNATTIAILHGGTGVTTLPTTANASAFAAWDSNKNLYANSFIESLTTTATAGTTTTLTVSSTQFQQFTGTTTQTVVLPAATTLAIGQSYTITNRSTGAITVNANGGGLIQTMIGGSQAVITVVTNGTSAGTWDSQYTQTGVVAFIQPTIQKFTSGTAQTYTTPTGVQYIKVRMVGGGGGGSGSGSADVSSDGGNGGNTTFGTSLLVANGGTGALWNSTVGSGGTASLGTGPIGTALTGGGGQGFQDAVSTTTVGLVGGQGGVSFFGGAGGGGPSGFGGGTASANTGSGGGGGGGTRTAGVTIVTGSGGGSGGYVDAIITSPLATYTYSVGTAGSAGGAGTNGTAAGAGAAGYIEVTEYYTNYSATTTTAVSANTVLAGPASGAAANPTFRALVNADLPAIISARYFSSTSTISGSYSIITYATQDYDTNSAYSGGTYTIPAGAAGKYQINAGIVMTGTSALGSSYQLAIFKNGTQINEAFELSPGSAAPTVDVVIADILNCAASDTITIRALSGATTPTIVSSNFRNFFSIARIGS